MPKISAAKKNSVTKGSTVAKCSQCRRDKQRCLPVERSWPGSRCDRCVQYEFECSASFTVSNDPVLKSTSAPVARIVREDPEELFEILDFIRFANFYLRDCAPNHPHLVAKPNPAEELFHDPGYKEITEKVKRDIGVVYERLVDAGRENDALYLISVAQTSLRADVEDESSDDSRSESQTDFVPARLKEKALEIRIKTAIRLKSTFTAQILTGKLLRMVDRRLAGAFRPGTMAQQGEQELTPEARDELQPLIDSLGSLYDEGNEKIFRFRERLKISFLLSEETRSLFLPWRFHHFCILGLSNHIPCDALPGLDISNLQSPNIWGENPLHVAARTHCPLHYIKQIGIDTQSFRVKPDPYYLRPTLTAYLNGYNELGDLLMDRDVNGSYWDPTGFLFNPTDWELKSTTSKDGSETWSITELMCRLGYLEPIKRLFRTLFSDPRPLLPWSRITLGGNCFKAAIAGQHLTVVELLVEHGALITEKQLQLAACNGFTSGLKVMLQEIQNRYIRKVGINSALQVAIENGQIEGIKALLHYGASVNRPLMKKYFSAAMTATAPATRSRPAMAAIAVAMIQQEMCTMTRRTESRCMYEHAMLYWGHKVLDIILPEDLDWKKYPFANLLRYAVYIDDLDCVSTLLSRGCPVYSGRTLAPGLDMPIYGIQTGCSLETLKLLLSRTAWMPESTAYYLDMATKYGHGTAVEWLLVQEQRNPDLLKRSLLTASEAGRCAIVKELLEFGADSSCRDGKGYSAIHLAALNGHVAVIRHCLEAGVPIDSRTTCSEQYTPLLLACWSKKYSPEVVTFLLENGADIEATSRVSHLRALHLAAREGNVPLIHALIDAGGRVEPCPDDATEAPLIVAVRRRKSKAVDALLLRGAKPSVTDSYGISVLQVAVRDGSVSSVRRLLEFGADIDNPCPSEGPSEDTLDGGSTSSKRGGHGGPH